MTSRRREPHSTIKGFARRVLTARTEGGTQIYVLCLFIMMFLLVLFRAMFDSQRLSITKDTVDDALMTSLVSACVYNREEKNSSGSVVMYQTVTPLLGEATTVTVGGRQTIDRDPVDVFSLPELYAPGSDVYLQNSWTLFLKNLKKNLKLGDDMTATISGIDGVVVVSEFSIYNKFYNLDGDRNQTDFKFVKYSYNPASDAWSVYDFAPNTYPNTYNSLTKTNYEIRESSISAELSFTVVTGTVTDAVKDLGFTKDDLNVAVTYQRVVDVKLASP